MLTHIIAYISAIFAHWLVSWGAIALMLIAMLEKWWKPIPKKLFFGIAAALLIVATFQAWQDQYTSAEWRGSEISRLNGMIQGLKSAQPQIIYREKENAVTAPQSLKQRTLLLANRLQLFSEQREAAWSQQGIKMYPDTPNDEQKRANFDAATTTLFNQQFASELTKLAKDFQAKGLDVTGLQEAISLVRNPSRKSDLSYRRPFTVSERLRELAAQIDNDGNLIR